MQCFLTQFVATVESMKGYLKSLSVQEEDPDTFRLYVDGNLMEHCGLSNVNSKSAEADNINRGQSGGPTDLMYFAELALLSWAFQSNWGRACLYSSIIKKFLSLSLF